MDDDEPMLLADNDDVIISQPGMHPPPPAYSQSHHHPYDVGGVALGNMVAGGSSSHSAQHTTIVINQPGQLTHMGPPRDWTSSLCSCCDDMGSCILGAFCPCILACHITSDMDESSCVPCCVPGWLIVLRSKLRTQHNIQGTVMDDCCVTVCCGNCVMCQMARELKYISTFSRPHM